MPTIPGVYATTQVVNRNPRGNSEALIALVGAADTATALGGVASPFLFTTYTQAATALGNTTANGKLLDMIYQAFNNGAKQVVAVVASVTGAGNTTEYSNALDALRTYDGIAAVAVEDTGATVAALVKSHVEFCATNNRFRRGYVGLPTGATVANYVTRAGAIASDRVFLVGPNPVDSTGAELAGGLTAAIGAMVAEKEADPARPITSAPVLGTSALKLKLLDSDYDTLHNAGVFTLSDRGGAMSVMRFLTTSVAADTIKEGTISKVRDYVMGNLKAILEGEFSRSKVTGAIVKMIEARVASQMTTWQKQEIVSPDASVTVVASVDATDKTKVNVTVDYSAVYPLNFISLNLTLNL